MNIELKDFQEDAVRDLLKQVSHAQREIKDGTAQALILSSPTGSGKTVTVTALVERIAEGDESRKPDTDAVFLWLSDSPELNTQSRDKILAQSSLFREHELVLIEPPFSREQFEPGKVYFLNTQKLGKDTLLTKTGDGRDFTIWQTIENTGKAKPANFFLIIDEAHRGMNQSARDVKQAQTIVQRFIVGDSSVGLSPMKLIIGISATTARFEELIGKSTRTKRQLNIQPGAVRESGLLKDRITLYCPDEDQPSDWTLLIEAAKRWKRFRAEWHRYCKEQGVAAVDPVLVIQVEDGTNDRLTRTDLSKAVEILERECGSFKFGALAHCFENDNEVTAGGHNIRKIEASKIERDGSVRVVFFKMALTTGWDCPRAEVMMSFRKAKDHTLIAQLVGRMVRTPLARRIEGSELLNNVALYLPHYNRAGLKAIVDKLADPENASPVEVVDGSKLVTVKKNPTAARLFDKLAELPSYSVERVPKSSNTRRLVKLARLLTFDEIDRKAWNRAKAFVVRSVRQEFERLQTDPKFLRLFKESQVIELREVQVEAGEWKQVDGGMVTRVRVSPENIEDLFDDSGRVLGEGLHKEYWKEHSDREHPERAKLELFGVLQDQDAWTQTEAASGSEFQRLYDEYKAEIKALPSSKREEYRRILRQAKDPKSQTLEFPPEFDVVKEEPYWDCHLYVEDSGKFGWKANTWEDAVLKTEFEKGTMVGWLRNFPRKAWSICVTYEKGETKGFFPDLIVFHKAGNRLRIDLLDPHNPELADGPEKARGLAKYAEKHGDYYDRIELIRVTREGQIQRLNVNTEAVRKKVLQVKDAAHLTELFESA